MEAVERLIQLIIDRRQPIVFVGTVKSVDVDNRTCVVSFEDGSRDDLQDCRLNSIIDGYDNHIVVVPKTDSKVILAQIEHSQLDTVIIAYSEIDSVKITTGKTTVDISKEGVVFNGGNLNGLVKLKELEDNLNSLKNYIQAIHAAMPAAFTAIGASSAAAGENGATSYQSAMAGKSVILKNMENDKIKQ